MPFAWVSVEHRWSLLVAGVYVLLVLAAFLLRVLVGDAWWNQLSNITTFWWLVPSPVLLVLALGFRRFEASALLVVPVVILVLAYGGQFVGSAPAEGPDQLKVVEYNMLVHTANVDHVVELVEAQDPDLLLLAEVTGEHADALRARLADRLPSMWFGTAGRFGGVAVLSRNPIVDVRPIEGTAPFERDTAVVIVDVPQGTATRQIQVVPVHLIAMCPICGPFAQRGQREVTSRRQEVAAIVAALDPNLPAIVGGDYNGNRWTQGYRTLIGAGFADPQRAVGKGLGFTYPGGHDSPGGLGAWSTPLAHLPLIRFPALRLDQVLVRGLRPIRAAVGEARASDHRPVIVTLGWTDG